MAVWAMARHVQARDQSGGGTYVVVLVRFLDLAYGGDVVVGSLISPARSACSEGSLVAKRSRTARPRPE